MPGSSTLTPPELKRATCRGEWAPLGPEWAPPRSFQCVSSGNGMDTGPVLALEPLSTIVGVRQQIHLLLLNPFLVPLYGTVCCKTAFPLLPRSKCFYSPCRTRDPGTKL